MLLSVSGEQLIISLDKSIDFKALKLIFVIETKASDALLRLLLYQAVTVYLISVLQFNLDVGNADIITSSFGFNWYYSLGSIRLRKHGLFPSYGW